MNASHEPARLIDAALLRGWPLPAPGSQADKESRGTVLVIGGCAEIPGAVMLAGTAALRAGAGKLVLATTADIAAHVAVAMPEARVIALPHSAGGELLAEGAAMLAGVLDRPDAVLVGPGMKQGADSLAFVKALLPGVAHTALVLDAGAMDAVLSLGKFTQPVLMTPHAGEMSSLCGAVKASVQQQPGDTAAAWAGRWNAVLALKGPITHIAAPHGSRWVHEGHDPGLATSGSGDVLAGLCAGLAARGASLEQAAAWAVYLHASSGARLAQKMGPVGYLARELAAEVPTCMCALTVAPPSPGGPALQVVF